MKWTKAEKRFVQPLRVARLATSDRNGRLYSVPICPLLDGGRLYFGSEADAKKVRNIKVNPGVTLVFDEYTEDWAHLRGIMIQGKARVVTAWEFRSLRSKIYAKYLQFEAEAPLENKDSAIIEVNPERKFSWGLD
jgi:nitroimidazol reductase NimA-like FMN-containing flavoprotein (pyridoxamine 5'-phosphate oxidase superfamily)